MGLTRSFNGFEPIEVYPPADGFDEIDIEEAEESDGPWTVIDNQSITVAPDPTDPPSYDFTTTEATLESGWYRIAWKNSTGGLYYSQPVAYGGALDLSDTKVLIPRLRRALVGPADSGFDDSELTDDETNALIADAVADVIFLTGTLFGHTLEVEQRDSLYLAPIAWSIDPALNEYEATVIVAQAALNYFYRTLSELKTAEKFADEGQEWSYQISANALAERIKGLQKARDEALDRVTTDDQENESWVSFIAARDLQTSLMIEPWVDQTGYAQQDNRFGTPL